MRLKSVRVKEFRSIRDSNEFSVGDVTCLVGKNEAGKTGLLQALYRLNPIIPKDGHFDVTDDYPRVDVEDYRQAVESRKRDQAEVVRATFALEADELASIHGDFGADSLLSPEIQLSKGYAEGKEKWKLYYTLRVSEPAAVRHLLKDFGVPRDVATEAAKRNTLAELAKFLTAEGQRQEQAFAAAQTSANALEDAMEKASALETAKGLAESEAAKGLRTRLAEILKHESLSRHLWETVLSERVPTFLYFDEYYQLRGHDNVQALKARQAADKLEPSDHPLLGLIELARLDLDRLLSTQRTQELKNNLQGTSNHLSKQILKYWSQNKHLQMHFDVRPGLGLPADPEGMRDGTNIWGDVYDSKHLVSTGLGTRSRGFVWFFSFLAWYSAVKKRDQPLVLLLDEPGLSLHGKAQEDLLRYFEAEIVTNPKHQLIYSTHSPFMVDSRRFDRVRIVEDKSIDSDGPLPPDEDGTKVVSDVLEVGSDALFPLQGALGYELYQSLFVGPNSLIVEGVSDLLYIQTMSGLLEAERRVGLDSRWTITPVGGADKVPTFVALIGSQKNLNLATLIDFEKSHQATIENLYKKKLLQRTHVMTFADFTGKSEADIEDMFDEKFYLELVNGEYAAHLAAKLKPKDIGGHHPRCLVRIEDYLKTKPLKGGAAFNHYRPARYFSEKVATLKVPADTLDRFETAFKRANGLLK